MRNDNKITTEVRTAAAKKVEASSDKARLRTNRNNNLSYTDIIHNSNNYDINNVKEVKVKSYDNTDIMGYNLKRAPKMDTSWNWSNPDPGIYLYHEKTGIVQYIPNMSNLPFKTKVANQAFTMMGEIDQTLTINRVKTFISKTFISSIKTNTKSPNTFHKKEWKTINLEDMKNLHRRA